MSELTLTVTDTAALTPRIRGLTLVPADSASLPPFTAGSHVEVEVPGAGTRHYSLVAFSPGEMDAPEAYRFGVLLEEESAGGSAHMHGLSVGDTIKVSAPKNDFPLAGGDAPSVLVAGGIGITPITAMATRLASEGRPFTVHYAGRSRPMVALVPELQAVCGDRLSLHYDDKPDTRIDLERLVASLAPEAHIYVCGPRGMIDAVRALAERRGVPTDRVHFELFSAAEAGADDGAFEVEVSSTGAVVTVPPGKSIIEALEEAGVDLVYDCQRGDCGICQTGVLEGVPDHRDVVLSEAERASNSVMQICVSRAKSPRLVLDL